VAGAAFFFIMYVTLVVFVFLNLFIAVILENFRSCYLKSDVCAVSLLDFEAYREVFLRYDVNNTGYFPLWQLGNFLAELPPGLRVDAHRERTAFLQLRTQAQAQWGPAVDGRKRPYFNELLRILCIHQLGIRSLPYEQQRDRVKQIFIYRAKVAQMLVDSYVKGYIQRWRMRRARLAQLALLKVDKATSTSDEGSTAEKSPMKEVQTQTEASKDRHRHHRHHHRKHRQHSKERQQPQVQNTCEISKQDDQQQDQASLALGPSHSLSEILFGRDVAQKDVEQVPKPSAKPQTSASPPVLPPLVIKRARDPGLLPPLDAPPSGLLGALIPSHSNKVHPS